jgi:transcriptional regulator with XRE-family HTH domain
LFVAVRYRPVVGEHVPLTISQCRAARALKGWSAGDLASASEVGIMTVHRFESGQSVRSASVDKLVNAFLSAGITFIAAGEASPDGGEGVRLIAKDS